MGGVASDSLSHPQTSQTARNWLPRETVSPLVCGHGGIGCPGDLCSGSEGLRVLEPVEFETFESLHRGFHGKRPQCPQDEIQAQGYVLATICPWYKQGHHGLGLWSLNRL